MCNVFRQSFILRYVCAANEIVWLCSFFRVAFEGIISTFFWSNYYYSHFGKFFPFFITHIDYDNYLLIFFLTNKPNQMILFWCGSFRFAETKCVLTQTHFNLVIKKI